MEKRSTSAPAKSAPSLEYAPTAARTGGSIVFLSLILAATSLSSVSLHFGHSSLAERHVDVVRLICGGAGVIAILLAATRLFFLGNMNIRGAAVPLFAVMLAFGGVAGAGLPPRQQRIRCQSCLRQIGLAMAAYARQNGGVPPSNLNPLILTFQHDADSFVCPNTGLRRTIVQARPGLPLRDDAILFYEPCLVGEERNVVYGDASVELLQKGPP
jgi:hypothetical protein